ncbi:MAG: response regulator transcription factor [Bacteroidetes bacterium]|nr:response regulator transcription factor [Bacteroidota bacterium]
MRILVVEDEPKLASFLERGLKQEGFAVDVATDGLQAESMTEENPYDLVVLDVMLPTKSGLEVCRKLRETLPRLPILMLTALDKPSAVVQGLNRGADDYLTKPFQFEVLVARIRALLRRAQVSTEMDAKLSCADLEIDLIAKTVTRAGEKISLTAREFMLLNYLLVRKGRIVSRMDILEKVWETSFDTDSNIVEVYINFLRKKIDKPFATKLLHTVVGMGYVLREPD